MKNFVLIAGFTVIVSLIYTGVAQLLPQLPDIPAPEMKLGVKMAPADLAEAGEKVFQAECSSCHKMGESGRAPDLSGLGGRAAGRASNRATATGSKYTGLDYIVESICKPQAYVVDPYGAMSSVKQKLKGGQFLALVAYLQDQGGTATANGTEIASLKRFGCITTGAPAPAGGAAKKTASMGKPETIFKMNCASCHSATESKVISAPSLYDVGKRLSFREIYESVVTPDKVIAKGFTKGTMKNSLVGGKFYEKMPPADYMALVDWLMQKKGGEE